MGIIKKLGTQTAIYGISSIIGRVINWALTPLYVQFFSMEDFGILSDLYSWSFYAIIFITFGMETAFFRFSGNHIDEKEAYANAFFSITGWSTIALFIAIFGGNFIANQIGYSDRPYLFFLVVGIILLDALAALPMARIRYQENATRFATISLCNIFISLFLNIYFILYLRLDIAYVFIANFFASFVRLTFALLNNFPDPKYINPVHFKKMFNFGLYIMLAGLAGAMNEHLDKNLLPRIWGEGEFKGKQYSGWEMNGIYSAMYKLAMIITLLTQAFRYAVEPFFFKNASKSDAPQDFSKIFHYFMITALVSFLLVSSLSYEIVSFNVFGLFRRTLIPNKYWVGLEIVPILLLANIFLAAYVNISVWFKITSQLRFGLFFSIFGLVITTIVNIIAIPKFGYVGSAYATLCCYASMCILCYYFGQRYYPIPYKITRILSYSAIILVFYRINELFVLKKMFSPKISLLKILICAFCVLIIFLIEKKYPVFRKLKSSGTGSSES